MKVNAYLLDCFKVVGPVLDASNTTNVPLSGLLAIARREGRPWLTYFEGVEIHFKAFGGPRPVPSYETFAEAIAYLLSPDGQAVLAKLGVEWPRIRLPNDVKSDLPAFIAGAGAVAPAGVYFPGRNPHGALFVKARDGSDLGVNPDEFEWVLTDGGAQ